LGALRSSSLTLNRHLAPWGCAEMTDGELEKIVYDRFH
jgi:hypothetical protein